MLINCSLKAAKTRFFTSTILTFLDILPLNVSTFVYRLALGLMFVLSHSETLTIASLNWTGHVMS